METLDDGSCPDAIDRRFLPTPPSDAGGRRPGWVRMDFHMHTYGSGDAVTTIEEFEDAVEAAGLDVVCVTDHNAVHVAQTLSADLDVRVVVGSEIKTREGELIGLFLDERISFGLPSGECARRIREQGGLVYVPHPIGPRNHAMGEAAMDALLSEGLLDAVEVFNSRNPSEAHNRAAGTYATRRGLPGGSGSDAHYPDEIGAAWLELPDFDGPDDLIASMADAVVVGERHPPSRSAWRPRIIPPSA